MRTVSGWGFIRMQWNAVVQLPHLVETFPRFARNNDAEERCARFASQRSKCLSEMLPHWPVACRRRTSILQARSRFVQDQCQIWRFVCTITRYCLNAQNWRTSLKTGSKTNVDLKQVNVTCFKNFRISFVFAWCFICCKLLPWSVGLKFLISEDMKWAIDVCGAVKLIGVYVIRAFAGVTDRKHLVRQCPVLSGC